MAEPFADVALSEEQRRPLIDADGRRLLTALLEHEHAPRYNHTCGDRLTPAALREVRDLDARLSLAQENETLRSGSTPQADNRIDELNRRLQAETAEKDRLRRELERAEAKLEAIATLEGATPPRP